MSSFQIGITGTSIVFGPHITLLYGIKVHHSDKIMTMSLPQENADFSSSESFF